MTWLPLLLADPSPNLRLLVLRDLLERGDDDQEVQELSELRASDPLVESLLPMQDADGSWRSAEGGGESWQRIRTTAQSLLCLSYMGFGRNHPAVQRGAAYLFSLQRPDGSWPLPKSKAERELREAYSMIPLQTGLPLRALAVAGFANDPRAENAYDWLLGQRLPDGAWPSGVKGDKNVFPAGYRRIAHSRFGCRTNTTFALIALAHHPQRGQGPETRRALDLILGHENQQATNLGFEVARTIGAERAQGFFTHFARYDVGLVLDLCWRVGATLEDDRVADMISFVRGLQGAHGLWTYPARPEVSRWVTFDLLRSLARIDKQGSWASLEPRTPFQPYPKLPRRY